MSNPLKSGPHMRAGFDFTAHMRRLCDDLVARLPQLSHIDLDRVAIGFSQTRKPGRYGAHASLTPMRFEGGKAQAVRRGRRWEIQRLLSASGREMLYILSFYLPRFLELEFEEKVTTVIHELWHISPKFDGDIRRHEGRFYAHGQAGKHDTQSRKLAKLWLSQNPPEETYRFLRFSFTDIQKIHGPIYGRRITAPKVFPAE